MGTNLIQNDFQTCFSGASDEELGEVSSSLFTLSPERHAELVQRVFEAANTSGSGAMSWEELFEWVKLEPSLVATQPAQENNQDEAVAVAMAKVRYCAVVARQKATDQL